MHKNGSGKPGAFCLVSIVSTVLILALLGSCAGYSSAAVFPPVEGQPIPQATRPALPVTGKAAPENFTLQYQLDRPAVPALTYNAVTLKIQIGGARSVSARAGQTSLPVAYSHQTGIATITTDSSSLEVFVNGAVITPQTGTFSLAALKDDRQWAWSHSFDDNVEFKLHGIPAFEQYGWRGTVYLIGSEINATRSEDWIVDRPDILTLIRKGWAIGNHTWSHQTVAGIGGADAARQDILRLDAYLREAAADAGQPGYRLLSFAAPAFDSPYQPVLLALRDARAADLAFNESGSDAILRVDSGATDTLYSTFDPNAPIGRDWRIDEYGSNSPADQSFRADLQKMTANLDATHHYWLNTFTHAVDPKYPDHSIFAFLPWVYQTYGPTGTNTVWVAPAEEIYSYLLTRGRVKVSFTLASGNPAAGYEGYLPLIRR